MNGVWYFIAIRLLPFLKPVFDLFLVWTVELDWCKESRRFEIMLMNKTNFRPKKPKKRLPALFWGREKIVCGEATLLF